MLFASTARPRHTAVVSLLAAAIAAQSPQPAPSHPPTNPLPAEGAPPPTTPPATTAEGKQQPAKAEGEAKPKADEPKPWRLNEFLGSPSWLRVSGEQRTRYETLDNQFRFRNATANPPVQGFGNSEDDLALRTSFLIEAKGETVSGTFEFLDARQYGIEANSFADTTMVNTADILQVYADLQLGSLGDGKHRLRVGREAIDLGNRRLIARNAYRNTINSFTGASWIWADSTDSLRVFWGLPVDRRPNAFEKIRDNEWELDDQDTDLQFWTVFYDHKFSDRTNLELYVFGLEENGSLTRSRELYTPGLRVNRTRKKGDFQYEMELALQIGESKTAATAASPKLDHLAGFGMIAGGYMFDMDWTPGVIASWSYASGDQDPNDRDNERFDTLFGARRFEYGPTGIWGAVARANLNSPELRLTLQPSKTVDFMIAARGVYLASERDAWTAAGLRDRTGTSGTHVAQQYEARIRWDAVPKSINLEVGAVYLAEGSFQDRASRDQGRDSTYGYVQATWTF
jgi:hypothetical protein